MSCPSNCPFNRHNSCIASKCPFGEKPLLDREGSFGETLLEREEKLKEKQREQDYLKRIRLVVPDLASTPFVKIPLKCRLRLHKNRKLGKVPNSHHDIWVCIRCGRVEAGWGYVSTIGGGNFYYTYGYINPNKPREFKKNC